MFLNLYERKGTTRTILEPSLASQLSFDKGVTNIWNNSIGARRKWWLVFGLYWDGTQEKENEARAIIQVLSPYVLVYFLNGIMLWVSMRYRMEKKSEHKGSSFFSTWTNSLTFPHLFCSLNIGREVCNLHLFYWVLFKKIFMIMYMAVLLACISVHHVHVWYLRRPERELETS